MTGRRTILSSLIALTMGLGLGAQAQAAKPKADVVFSNGGCILTMKATAPNGKSSSARTAFPETTGSAPSSLQFPGRDKDHFWLQAARQM